MRELHFIPGCALAGLMATAVIVSPARAQDLPAEGKFAVTYTVVNSNPMKAIPIGKDREVLIGVSLASAVNDGGSGLLHNMAGRCAGTSIIDRSTKTMEFSGYCNYADRGGDQVYEEYSTPGPQTLGTPPKIKGKWIGGTGKFAGLSGEFDITNSGPLPAEGATISIGKKIGSFKISK